MKKLFITLLAAVMAIGSFAQTEGELALIQKTFGIEKLQVVLSFVNPGNEYQETFINIYEEYEDQRMELGKERFDLLTEYADKWNGMTEAQADEWMKKVIDLSKRNDKLITKYYTQIKKNTNGLIAARFYQVEALILSAIRYSILDEIPLVEDKK